MLSYREKQLFAVQKYLLDESAAFSEQLCKATERFSGKENFDYALPERPELETYGDLVEYVQEQGYDLYIRAEDILSPQELKQLDQEYAEIDRKFKEVTKLHKADYAFMFAAIGLIIAKQFFLKLDLDSKITADQTDTDFHEKYDNKTDDSSTAKRYYAPMDQIANSDKVPYDVVKNTSKYSSGKETGLGLSPKNHRYRSLGHDPALGLVFGTGNIMTNTATFYSDSEPLQQITAIRPILSYHVSFDDRIKYTNPHITTNASTVRMVKKMIDRIKDEPKAFLAALVKEIRHIRSDEKSIAGIPIPFLTYFLGSDKAQELASKGFNYANLKVVAEQALISEFINFLVSFFYRIYCIWDLVKEADNWKEKADVILHGKLDIFDEVRSRKIILYSNVIASLTNVLVCGGGALLASAAENAELSKKFLEHLDIGGYLVTIRHLYTDGRFIAKVKKEFIRQALDENFDKKLIELQEQTGLDILDDAAILTQNRLQPQNG